MTILTAKRVFTKSSHYIVWQIELEYEMSAIPYQSFTQDFKFQKIIGKGNCAVVNQVLHVLDRKTYAHKLIISQTSDELAQTFNEIEVILAIDNQQATKIHYYYVNHNRKTAKYELGIIMELCETNLLDLIRDRRKRRHYFKVDEVRNFLAGMIPLFAKMQKMGYLHRDIKPDNVLIAKERKLNFRMADFGFALKLNCYSSRNIAGTMEYVSPKLLVKFKNQKASIPAGHNFKDDVYSFGKTLSEMMLLETGQVLSPQKMGECKARYGKQLGNLLEMMMATNQIKRADFCMIEECLFDLGIVAEIVGVGEIERGQGAERERLNSTMSSRSVSKTRNKLVKKQQDSFSTAETVDFRHLRYSNDSKTKRKCTQESIQTTIEAKIETNPQGPCHVVRSDRWGDVQKMTRKQMKTKENISCLAFSEHLLFMGLENMLGVMVMATQKQIRMPHAGHFDSITCLEVSEDQQKLYIGDLNCKVYIISINQLNKLVIKNIPSFKINNALEIPFTCLNCREVQLASPISTLLLLPDTSLGQSLVIAGHHTGDISVITDDKVDNRMSFMNQPITCIRAQDNALFTSSATGIFKRQNASLLGIKLNQKILKGHPVSKYSLNLNLYKCESAILTFEIITGCKTNLGIEKEAHQYLAALACCEGFIHVISKEMRCERLVRVSHFGMLAGVLQVDVEHVFGVVGLFAGEEGALCNQQGRVLRQLKQKSLVCVAANQNSIFLGGFHQKLIQLCSSSTTIDID